MATYTQPLNEFDTTTTDGNLGAEVDTDRNRPPLGSFCFGPAYDGTCFILKDNRLYYCKPKRPEEWPALYYVEVGSRQLPLKTGLFYNGQPYIANTERLWHIQGTGAGVFNPIPMNSKTGAQSINGAAAVTGKGIYHTGPDGIYLYSNGIDTKITEDTLEPIFRGETVEGLPGVNNMANTWLFAKRNYLYFGYPASGQTYGANVIVLNLQTGKLNYYLYNDGANVEIRAITWDSTNKRILVGDNTGYVRVIESPSNSDDSGTAISWEIQSKDFTLPTRAHFPRFVKYDVDASSATSVTGTLLLDGVSHQTHTITGDRITKRRLVGTGNGNKAALRISGSGPATVHTAEFE